MARCPPTAGRRASSPREPSPTHRPRPGARGGGRDDGQLPSLRDYDEAEYPEDVHDQSLILRAERAVNSAIIWSAVLVIDKLYEDGTTRDFTRSRRSPGSRTSPFLSVLLYETLGFWHRADYLKVHFAQTMNEFHHLLIMESMGGDERFTDRFFAQHMAVFYYFIAAPCTWCRPYGVQPERTGGGARVPHVRRVS